MTDFTMPMNALGNATPVPEAHGRSAVTTIPAAEHERNRRRSAPGGTAHATAALTQSATGSVRRAGKA